MVVSLEDLKLWQPLNAYLYKAQVNLCKEGEIVDVYEEIRHSHGRSHAQCNSDQRQTLYFKGYGKHEDIYINGRGINEATISFDINLMRWMAPTRSALLTILIPKK